MWCRRACPAEDGGRERTPPLSHPHHRRHHPPPLLVAPPLPWLHPPLRAPPPRQFHLVLPSAELLSTCIGHVYIESFNIVFIKINASLIICFVTSLPTPPPSLSQLLKILGLAPISTWGNTLISSVVLYVPVHLFR